MQVQGMVTDANTGTGIPGASVIITDINGTPTGEGVAADNGGHFNYDGTTLDTAKFMLFSSVGYKSALSPYQQVLQLGGAALTPNATVLPDVVVTPSTTSSGAGSNTTLWIVLAAVLVGIFALKKRK